MTSYNLFKDQIFIFIFCIEKCCRIFTEKFKHTIWVFLFCTLPSIQIFLHLKLIWEIKDKMKPSFL